MSVFVVSIEGKYEGQGSGIIRPLNHIFSNKENAAVAIYNYIKADEHLVDALPDDVCVYDQNDDLNEEATNQKLFQKCLEIVEIGGYKLWSGSNDKIRVEELTMNSQLLIRGSNDWSLPNLIPFSEATRKLQGGSIYKYQVESIPNSVNKIIILMETNGAFHKVKARYDPETNQIYPPV